MAKKEIFANILNKTKVFDILSKLNQNNFFVFNYHRLYSSKLQTPFDEGVCEYTIDTFETHLKWIKNNFDVLSEKDVLNMSNDGKVPKRCALITFDDGYIDNYSLAFPLLKSYNLPAIFFIPTQAIDERVLGWWDIISYLIKKSPKEEIIIDSRKFQLLNHDQKEYAIAYFVNKFKTTPFTSYEKLIDILSVSCDVEIPSYAEQSEQLMTWENLNEVIGHNITIGSHTHTHRVLNTLDENEQFNELQKSKKILENKLNCKINSLSYPVGEYSHFSTATKKIAKKAGYKICFSNSTGFNKNSIDPYDIKRFGLSSVPNIMKGQLVLPSVFCRKYKS